VLTYRGKGPIERTKDGTLFAFKDRYGRSVSNTLLEVIQPRAEQPPHKEAVPGADQTMFEREYSVENLSGRRCQRIDTSSRDAAGEMRLQSQLWVDLATMLPVRATRRLQFGEQTKYKREFEVTDYDYPKIGPADLHAIGVPERTPVVDAEKFPGLPGLPETVQRAVVGGAEAVRRFPREARAVALGENMLSVAYWSLPQEWVSALCDGYEGKADRVYLAPQPQIFEADNQDPAGRPVAIQRALDADPLDADAVAGWLPVTVSVNVRLFDGRVDRHLTRFVAEPGKPANLQLHVLKWHETSLPKPLEALWPHISLNRKDIASTKQEPEPDTPPGVLFVRTERDDMKTYCEVDPGHDFIASRNILWWKWDGEWYHKDVKAAKWARLPNGSWTVTDWVVRNEVRTVSFGADGKQSFRRETVTNRQRAVITPMPADRFPQGLFDVRAFDERAKAEGAEVHVD
jgi:hypothetical protein